ncbi:tyrosine-type recombinase/integrase [Antarctobacter sp.]|uniref:tyrosine-type recombinase/integrase n=1 Tax=Antarctobacter sp. TaxID=1872577 RepID=UPI002B26D03D|nr:integrase arm-type DNA-binding domain-containing protein [Antarctobacter sp.]
MAKLTARSVASLKKAGMHGDGDGLYLAVSQAGAKSWILRVRIKGETRRREIGLGTASLLSLADARKKSQALRAEAKEGRNPIGLRDKRNYTFKCAAIELHRSLAQTFKSGKHGALWIASLENHVFPAIGEREIESIRRDDLLSILTPLWTEKHDTARRIKQRIGNVFDWAIGAGHYAGSNPVDGPLNKALPRSRQKAKHHNALPWRDVPTFMGELSGREAIAARCLELIILTATRSNEARGARWSEINLGNAVWTIPADRMKMGETHRIPLSERAVRLLKQVEGLHADLVFPSPQTVSKADAKPLSVNAFRPLFARMGREGTTAHGFRSSFRDWAAESARADREVAEAALAHKVGGVEGAYFRSDLFDRRRDLMEAWGRYIAGEMGTVVKMVRA